MAVSTMVPTGTVNAINSLRAEIQALKGNVHQLREWVASLEKAFAEPIEAEGGEGTEESRAFTKADKVRILEELRNAEDRDRLYKQYGITVGHFRAWSRLEKAGAL